MPTAGTRHLHHLFQKVNMKSIFLSATLITAIMGAPLSDSSSAPVPGLSSLYSTYFDTTPPYPGNETGAILNTSSGPPGADDLLFQNLLSAEWIIFSFYQQGIEFFSESSFTDAGFPNTSYSSLATIRDNEAGHLATFQSQISNNSVKPGPCSYKFPFDDVQTYLALQTVIEVSSMAFLTGLELQATIDQSKSALIAIAATESRHNTWSLIQNWASTPFAGPADTVFPYANQILDFTNTWVVNDSCPPENPVYPSPRQNLPPSSIGANSTGVTPGSRLQINFTNTEDQPRFQPQTDYYVVFCHGVLNMTVPYSVETSTVTIPAEIESLGIIIAVVSDDATASTPESVVAAPLILVQSPARVVEALGQ